MPTVSLYQKIISNNPLQQKKTPVNDFDAKLINPNRHTVPTTGRKRLVHKFI